MEIRKDIGPLVNKTHQVLNTTPGCTFWITSHLCQKILMSYFSRQFTGSAKGRVFPLVNSGILLSSSSFPHGQPKPVLPCVVCHSCHSCHCCHTLDHLSIFHLSNPLPLPGVREASSLPSTVGCCIPSRDPGHLVLGHLWFSCSVKKPFNDTGRWEVVGSSMSCQCLRKFVSSLGDQPESAKKAANWASVIRWRSVYKSGTYEREYFVEQLSPQPNCCVFDVERTPRGIGHQRGTWDQSTRSHCPKQ